MIIGVVGGREFQDYALMCTVLDTQKPTMIVSGGAQGADALAYKYAVTHGITFVCHPPLKEDKDGPGGFVRAYKRRNLRIVVHCETLVAFPTAESRGTWHAVGLAKRLKKPCHVVGP